MDWIYDQLQNMVQPHLAYIHLWPPHDPCRARKEFVDKFLDHWNPPGKEPHVFSQGHSDELLLENRRLYDEYLAYVDYEFGRLYDALNKAGILEKTILILTSNHGEMFERGIYGHITPALFEPVIHIPLLISIPGQTTRKDIYTPSSNTDLLPTILSLIGSEIPDWIEGIALSLDSANSEYLDIFAMDSGHIAKNGSFDRGSIALIRDPYKLVRYFGYDGLENRYELYNLQNDPEEFENRHILEPAVAEELTVALSMKLDQVNRSIL